MKNIKTNVKWRRLFAIALTAIIGFALALAVTACPDGNGIDPDPTGTPIKTLTGITAEYVPTTEIFPDTNHDTLKEGLTVKAQYSDSTDKTLNDADYSLIGELNVGESVITVSYTEGGVTKTTTFKVTVDALTHAHNWQFKSTTATCTTAGEELWECDAIDPAHHEDRPAAALGHIWEWVVDSPSAGIDTQVCSRDPSHIGETRYVFTTAADMITFLSNPATAANTADTPYNIKLNATTLPWTSNGAAQTAFSGKYVNLDLSGSTLTSIGNNAFYGCTGLTGITIPNSVTSINSNAFTGCTGLTSITIPEGVTTINGNAFTDCANLTNIVLNTDKVTNNYTTNWLTRFPADNLSITFEKNVGEYAFYSASASPNTRLKSVTIAEGVTSIGGRSFSNCTGLTSITIPNSVTSIDERAFQNCTSLTDITIPEGVTTIGDYAFAGCIGLTSVTIPEGVKSISYTFDGCTSLKSVTIPASITSISISAFNNCTSLTSITIPDSVTSFGQYAFQNCTSLTSITIPNSVTFTSSYVFNGCTGLTSVTIGNGLSTINGNLFAGCTGLTSITIPNNVKTIYTNAFNGCTGLASVTFAGTVPSTGWTTSNANAFLGDLRDKFYATETANGTPGTYTTTAPVGTSSVWTKQSS